MSRIKLFCVPYAGASSMVYSKWKKGLADFIELQEVELPGRGRRYSSPFCGNIDEAVEDIIKQIESKISDGGKYAFFGHSMGTLIVYELVNRIKEVYDSEPVHIFFSGRNSPDIKVENKVVHTLSDEEFKFELNKFGGIPDQIFENEELAKIFIPILRADYKLIDTYNYAKKKTKLNTDMTVFYGTEDAYIKSDIKSWEKYTTRRCDFIEYEGGHFFINTYMKEIICDINNILASYKD
ncbi:surfactin synthase thioesterase subunit [Ruminiclostridium sufflavum DSM 19573]|uniref:Surfactin synthase thioesterase subunit n=1 Tax=Ruminiclostridium sufflavum DSM 19573 TaxID=1121337 RepID=A0A318XMI7_9FIRM|nr:thioesterase domain-containing protein [Ruminiclostridium sufflavum]PYG89067.1 surfactin synthase thioesterase subunit [Ruminiclostridium sufflavum DSM 19573]